MPAAPVADAVASYTDDDANAEATLEHLLTVDREHDTWTFDDIDLDSGTFGELVSRGIVEKIDGEYRLVDQKVVAAAVRGDAIESVDSNSNTAKQAERSLPAIDLNGVTAVGVVGAFVLLFLTRLINAPSVFRDGYVVSPGNDPYYFRYWMDTAVAETDGVGSIGSLVETYPAMESRPLTHAGNWMIATLLGGEGATALVAGWLPVAFSMILGGVLFGLAIVLTRDVRVAIITVVLLALTPVHAVYMGVGFLDHQSYQYLALGASVLALAWLGVDLRDRLASAAVPDDGVVEHLRSPRTWGVAVAGGLAVAASVLAWGGSVLMLLPLCGYVGMMALSCVRSDVSTPRAMAPIVGVVAVSTAAVVGLHVAWGWQEPFVAAISGVTLLGTLGVVGIATLWDRTGLPVWGLLASEAAIAVLGLVAFRAVRPDEWSRIVDRSDSLFGREGITEVGSLFTPELGIIFGPVAQIGVEFYLAVPVILWAAIRAYQSFEPAWLAMSVYAVFWTLLAAIQVRFAGQLVVLVAVLGAIGFVRLLAWIDLARMPAVFTSSTKVRADGSRPEDDGERGLRGMSLPADRRSIGYVIGIGVLVCGLSLVYVPTLAGQVTYSDAQFGAAMAINEEAESEEYPENFVLSEWGDNRMFNYFVNEEASSYGYARQRYTAFLQQSPAESYESGIADRAGYIVTQDIEDVETSDSESNYDQLHHQRGSASDNGSGSGHHRLLYESADSSVKAFEPVEGAIVAGQANSEEITVGTDVSAGPQTVQYERSATVAENGWYGVRVANPGTYDETAVDEDDLETGEFVGERSGEAVWEFEEGRGEYVFDPAGGNHGFNNDAEWIEPSNDESALRFDGESSVVVPHDEVLDGSDGFELTVTFRTDPDVDYEDDREFPRIAAKAQNSAYSETEGLQLAMTRGRLLAGAGDGEEVGTVRGPRVDDGEWHEAIVRWDGTELSVTLDGEQMGTTTVETDIATEDDFVIGASSDRNRGFSGEIQNVTLRTGE